MFSRLHDLLTGRLEAKLRRENRELRETVERLKDYLREQLARIERDDKVLHRYVQKLAEETRGTRDLHGRMIDRLVRQLGGEKINTPMPPPNPAARYDPDKTTVRRPGK